tara:strand:- start:432 stop:1151 length:720 start_codon:yes stop_codon:yes gene_type:complete
MLIKKVLLMCTLFYASLCFAENKNLYSSFKAGASFGQNTGLVNYDNAVGEGGEATLKNSDLSSSLTSGISVGMYFTNNLRGDFSLEYKNNQKLSTTDSPTPAFDYTSSFKSVSSFLTGFYDFNSVDILGKSITPFALVGIGYAINESGKIKILELGAAESEAVFMDSDFEENIVWKVGAGASVNITQNLIFDMQYEFVDLGHAQAGYFFRAGGMTGEMEIPMKFDYRTHDFNVGLRYNF